ncbi:PTS sugar transporter subunit IIA [Klebsiella quasipneumoniae]|uniref:PTS sugar transporter subunit IIA n=1 Tax=Klebsiella quasipneumoniae TaxID=1463165 RepID=UPI0029E7F03B|nr:PTS sugar transporter subunit IIA [Klebsiella quasipneumoniae]
MTDNLWLHHRTDNRDQLTDDIWTREDSFSTAVGYGFAIPHTKSDHIHYSTISMATLRRPLCGAIRKSKPYSCSPSVNPPTLMSI